MIKAVIFDIDNTLYNYTAGHLLGMEKIYGYVKRELGISRERLDAEVERMFLEVRQEMGYHNVNTHNRLIRYQRLLEQWKMPIFPHALEIIRLYDEGTLMESRKPYEGVLDFLAWAKEKGLILGIGTDMNAYNQLEKLWVMGTGQYMDFIVTSEEAQVEKPHPEFFAQCVKKAGVKPEECVFVGDNVKKDVQGSMRCGLIGVWHQPDAEKETPDGVQYRISHYAQLQKKIQEWNQWDE